MSTPNLKPIVLITQLITLAMIVESLAAAKFGHLSLNSFKIPVIQAQIFTFYTWFLMLLGLLTGSWVYSLIGMLIFNVFLIGKSQLHGGVTWLFTNMGYHHWSYYGLHYSLNLVLPNLAYLIFNCLALPKNRPFNYYRFSQFLLLVSGIQIISRLVNNYCLWLPVTHKALEKWMAFSHFSAANQIYYYWLLVGGLQTGVVLGNNILNGLLFGLLYRRLKPLMTHP